MRRSNNIFSSVERRLAVFAVVAVAVLVGLTLVTGGIFNPSVGTGGQAGSGFAELPGVMEATPLN